MSVAKEQREKLIWEFPNIGKKAPEQEEKAFAYCEGYKEFLNAAKTEREFVREAVLRLKEAGYEEFEEGKIYQPGDKVYQINRKKALLMSTFGKRPLEDGVRINVAHIDSPRLDLKPNPLYEKAEAAYFKDPLLRRYPQIPVGDDPAGDARCCDFKGRHIDGYLHRRKRG